ncbi:Mg(2+) transport ATPase, P-type [Yersinia pseudotuberculosis]|nr:Magnesium-transporting ATPase, P-type 1 [Yersinia pseudotuberculosis]SUP86824.1 Mg(2+) transport ATPase, P-type [Yersinia pseudotuberculosis]
MRKLEKTDTNRSNNKKPFAIALEAKNSLEQTLFKLNTHLNGLTEEDARERLELYGVNQVAHEKAPPAFLQLLAAFNNPFIFVLIILASISFFTDYWLPLQEGGKLILSG